MADYDDFDENAAQRTNNAPYTPHHPIPTIQRYHGYKEERQAQADAQIPDQLNDSNQQDNEGGGGYLDSVKRHLHLGSASKDPSVDEDNPYQNSNRNVMSSTSLEDKRTNNDHQNELERSSHGSEKAQNSSVVKDTSEAIDNTLDPRQKRKNMKHMTRDHATREVTDPVTHLKVTVHDSTDKELKTVPENEPAPGINPRSSTTPSKGQDQLEKETEEQQAQHRGMEKLFPPPQFDATREEIARVYTLALTVGLETILVLSLSVFTLNYLLNSSTSLSRSWLRVIMSTGSILVFVPVVGGTVIWGLRDWLNTRIHAIWENEIVRRFSIFPLTVIYPLVFE